MIYQDDFEELKTLWRKRWPFIGTIEKKRLTYGNRVVEVVSFQMFGRDVAISKTIQSKPETLPLL